MKRIPAVLAAVVLTGLAYAEEFRAPELPSRPLRPAPVANTDPVTQFGVERSESLSEGFLFREGKYVPSPYVVERRGLTVCVNGIVIYKGHEWPPFDERVEEDPGDPPAGSSPLDPAPAGVDPRNTYWARKARYLRQHNDYGTGLRMVEELWARGRDVVSVGGMAGVRYYLEVRDPGGSTRRVDIGMPAPFHEPLAPERALSYAAYDYRRAVSLLGSRAAYVAEPGDPAFFGPHTVEKFLGILLSDAGKQERVDGIARLSPDSGKAYVQVVDNVGRPAQLLERFEALRAKARQEPPPSNMPAPRPRVLNSDTVQEFGVQTSGPHTRSFLFYRGEYIPGPYLVERRGLDVYLNGTLQTRGPEWPPFDERVDEDPGDPPPGSSPDDPLPPDEVARDTYWPRKARYLYQHYDRETAAEMMMEAWRKGYNVESVEYKDDERYTAVVTLKDGSTYNVGLDGPCHFASPMTAADAFASAYSSYHRLDSMLQGRHVALMGNEIETFFEGDQAQSVLDTLLSDLPRQGKIDALNKVRPLGQGLYALLVDCADPVLLAERVKALREQSSQTPEAASPRAPTEADLVAIFGKSRSLSFATGFLFYGGKYVDAPYLVERRGLSVYVNGILVKGSPEYPPYDYRVKDDPGPPPAASVAACRPA